jgi:hypothetical protein
MVNIFKDINIILLMSENYIYMENADYKSLNDSSVKMKRETYHLLLFIIIIFGSIITLQFMIFIYYTRESIRLFCFKNNPVNRIHRKRPLQIQMGELEHSLEISPTEEIKDEQSNK